jgi:hypothetical protein
MSTGSPEPGARSPEPRPVLAALLLLAAACSRGTDARPVVAAASEFIADSAMSYVRQQVAFGPRVAGSEGWRRAGDWIAQRLLATADTVIEQRWTHRLEDGRTIPQRNLLARFRPRAPERVLYLTHWDTRPVADNEPVPADRERPIPGANDGASGVALLLGVADALKKRAPAMGVDLLFVDGEDYGTWGPPDTDVLIGSTYFAAHLPDSAYRPLFGVLWDMIGDADLNIPQELHSAQQAPEVVQRVWQKAKDLGYDKWFLPDTRSYPITDDHYPLLKAGLRVINVIDIDYPHHHRLSDTVDKVSVKSLQIVGDVAMALLR